MNENQLRVKTEVLFEPSPGLGNRALFMVGLWVLPHVSVLIVKAVTSLHIQHEGLKRALQALLAEYNFSCHGSRSWELS